MKDLVGRVAIVTGASKGIGVHIARALAAEKAHLVLAARSGAELETLAVELRGLGVQALSTPVDITLESGRETLLQVTKQALGGVDILVNNAGIEQFGAYHATDARSIEYLITLNLLTPMLLTRAVLPTMLAQRRGHIVNIASLAGRFTPAYHEAYNTSKAGLIHFTHSLRASYRDSHISASVVTPGFIRSAGMFQTIQDETQVEVPPLMGTSPPEKVATAVVRAIKQDRAEIPVSPRPIWPLLFLRTFFPGLTERIQPRLGNNIFRQAAEKKGSNSNP